MTPGTGKPLVHLNSSHDLPLFVLVGRRTDTACVPVRVSKVRSRYPPGIRRHGNFSWRSHSHPRSSPGLLFPPCCYSNTTRSTRPQRKAVRSLMASLSLTASPKDFARAFQATNQGGRWQKKVPACRPTFGYFFTFRNADPLFPLRAPTTLSRNPLICKSVLDVAQRPCKLIDRAPLCFPPTPLFTRRLTANIDGRRECRGCVFGVALGRGHSRRDWALEELRIPIVVMSLLPTQYSSWRQGQPYGKERVFVLRGVASTEAAKYARAYHPLNSPHNQTLGHTSKKPPK